MTDTETCQRRGRPDSGLNQGPITGPTRLDPAQPSPAQSPVEPNPIHLVAMLVILRNMAETRQCDMAVCICAVNAARVSQFLWRGEFLCGVAPFRVLIALGCYSVRDGFCPAVKLHKVAVGC